MPLADHLRPLTRPICALDTNSNLPLESRLVRDRLDLYIGRTVRGAIRGSARDDDLLDELHLKGADRIKPVDQVVQIAMGCRVPEGAEGIQGLDRLARSLGRIDALRLVDDHDGAGGLNELDWLATGELVALLVDDVAL